MPPRARAAAFIILALLAGAALSASLSVRGGFPDDNDFQLLSSSAFSWARGGAPLSSLPTYKELAPRLFLDLAASAGGLSAVERLQPLLWAAGAFLAFAFLTLAGAQGAAACFGAGLLSLSFLALLAARSLGTTWANLVLILLSLAATARLARESEPIRAARALAAALTALLLVLLARFEFAPPLAAALAAAAFSRRAPLARLKPRARALLAAWAALIAVLAVFWTSRLLGSEPLAAPRLSLALSNLSFQLGTQNLSRLLPLPASAWPALAALLAALAFRTSRLWTGVLVFWLAWFALIYKPTSPHLLYNARHHLYVFLPLALLAGLAAAPFLRGRRGPLAAALLVLAWGLLNARQARLLESEWRTNDKEWRLLLKTRREWPAGCSVVHPFADSRRGVLRRFFPFANDPRPGGCLYSYRSAYPQVFEAGEEVRNDLLDAGRHPYLYDEPWLEEKLEHRFYTNAPDEKREPLEIRVGFHRLSDKDLADPRWTLLSLDARLIENDAAALDEAAAVRPADFRHFGRDAGRLRAKFLSDRAVAKARNGRPGAEADLREALRSYPGLLPAAASLGALLEGSGKTAPAREVYRKALKSAAPGAYPRERALLENKLRARD